MVSPSVASPEVCVMETAGGDRPPVPCPRAKRSQTDYHSITPASPVMIKRSAKSFNFLQGYGGKIDQIIIQPVHTDASGTVLSCTSDTSAAIVKMNEPMSPLWNYFEVEIIRLEGRCTVGIGVGPFDNVLHCMPGWTPQSFGYHSDDGNLFRQNSYVGLRFGPTCMKGDVMGCGIDYEGSASTGYVRLWFTKNSTVVGASVKAKMPFKGFYSLIGMHYRGVVVKYLGHSQQKTSLSLQSIADYPFPSTLLAILPQDGIGPKQLTLCVGDEVIVTEEEWLHGSEWLEGTKSSDGTVGLFCRKFVKLPNTNQPLESATSPTSENVGQVHVYKGKEFTFVKEPEPWYACIICQELAAVPLQTTCCAQTLCQNCTDTCRKRQLKTCPYCRKDHWEASPDARLTRLISNLEVLCHNHLKGCQWRRKLRGVQEHLDNECNFELIPCPGGCNVLIERRHVAKHIRVECLDAKVRCIFCSSMMTKRKLFYHHHKICSNWPVFCPHMCKERKSWTRDQLTQHLQDGCNEEIVKCEFASVGCSTELKRKELKDHMQSEMASHLTLLLRENIALKEEMKDLKDTVQALQC